MPADDRANNHREKQNRDRSRVRRPLAELPENLRPKIEPGKRPEHVHVTMREVDEPQDAKHHRVPQRNQRVDTPLREPVDELLKKLDQLG